MHLHGENCKSSEIFFRTGRLISKKRGILYWGIENYNLFINRDLWMTLTCFTAR